MQPLRPGLAATWIPGSSEGGENKAGLGTQVAGICQHKYLWGKTDEICKESEAAVVVLDFFRGNSCWGPLQSSLLETTVPPVIRRLLFFLVPRCLYLSQLCWSLGRLRPKQVLWGCSERLEKLVSHLILPFPGRGTILAGELPFGIAGGGVMQEKWGCSSFFLCVIILSVFFFHYLVEVYYIDSWALPKQFLFMNSCLVIDNHGGMEAGVLLFCCLCDITSQLDTVLLISLT